MPVLYTLTGEGASTPHYQGNNTFPFRVFVNRCGLGGCSGHSSRKKKADVADAFQGLLICPWRLPWASFNKHLQMHLHWATQRLKFKDVNAFGNGPHPGGSKLENKYLDQIRGYISLSKPDPWLFS